MSYVFADTLPATPADWRRTQDEDRVRQSGIFGVAKSYSHYREDFIGFCVNELGDDITTILWALNPEYEGHEWDGTASPWAVFAEALQAGRDIGIEAATGTQKTWTLSRVVLWFLACWEDSIVVTAAPKKDQLLLHVWKEVGRVFPRFKRLFPEAELTSGKLRVRGGVDESWAATAFVCGVGADEEAATKAQGFHAEHMLIITEETPGIHPAIMRAFDNTRTDEHNPQISVGNPDHQADELHQFCIRSSTTHIRISALDHPNVVTGRQVVPGAISRRRINERRDEFGEHSRLYQSRVRGISPSESAEALIKRQWCEDAATPERYERVGLGLPGLGVDVANSPNGDKAAIARGSGPRLFEVESFPCEDSNVLGADVAEEMAAGRIEDGNVGVDPAGVGAGTFNELKAQGFYVPYLNASLKPQTEYDWQLYADLEQKIRFGEKFRNLRAQMWWRLREDLRRGYIALPKDDELWADLTAIEWESKNGFIVIEDKSQIKKRLQRSPDKGEAVMLWNWCRDRQPPPEPEMQVPDDPEYDAAYFDTVAARQTVRSKRGRGF